MPRDDEMLQRPRWSDIPPGDPHRDLNGALHDVSNALTVLLGWLAEAREAPTADQAARALGIVEERARAARDVARRAIGASVMADREEALDAVVGEVVETLSVEAHRGGISLVVRGRTPGVLVPMAADASQILTNLVLNAIAWSPRDATVTVEVRAEAMGVEVLVQDDGPGVPAAQAPFLFDGVSTREGGAGVGLRHARAVARAAGGEIELQSKGRPGGALFSLRWPRILATLPRAPVSVPRPAVLAGRRVLVVEDDADVASLLEAALGARGAEVVVVRTSEELEARAGDRHDAALVDLSPIAHDVRGAIDSLRRGSPGAVLVFISGSATGLPLELEDERVRWVRKPFEVSEVLGALVELHGRGSDRPPPR